MTSGYMTDKYKVITTPLYTADSNSGNIGSAPIPSSGPPAAENPPVVNNSHEYRQLPDLSSDTVVDEILSEAQKKAEIEVNSAVYGKILNR